MKLTRRNALMAAVGSIFGGKDSAKSILDTSRLMRGEDALKGGYNGLKGVEGIHGYPAVEGIHGYPSVEGIHGYPAGRIEEYDKQIANLTRLMNGGLEEWQIKHLESTQDLRRRQELFRIDNLKSVSPIYKLSMADRHSKQLMKENWKLDAERELKSVLGFKDNFLKSLAGGVSSEAKDQAVNKANYHTTTRG